MADLGGGVHEMIILKRMLKKNGVNSWTGLLWLRMGISEGGGLLCTW